MMPLRPPKDLALLHTRTQYLSELNDAQNLHIIDWPMPEQGTFEKVVGKLTLRVRSAGGRHEWEILHERAGRVNSGSSEDLTLAQQEAVQYAMHFVKHGMVGLNA